MKRKTFLFGRIRLVLSVVLVGVSLRCSDKSSSVGIGLLPPEDLVTIDSLVLHEATGSSFKQFISPNGISLLIGSNRGYEARTLVRFLLLPDTLADARLLSANLLLKPLSVFGDSTALLSFTVHKILRSWSELTATWDSVDASFYESTPRGSFSQVVSGSDSVEVPIDTSLVREWLTGAASGTDQFGILLLPAPGMGVIRGFDSFQSADSPTLDVDFEKSGTVDSLLLNIGYDMFVANVGLPPNPELMYVQSGVSYRSMLRFDLLAIPSNVIIHNATVELTIDRVNSDPEEVSAGSVLVHHVSDSTTNSFESSSAVLTRGDDTDPNLMTANITLDVRRWLRGESNQGVLLRSFVESIQLDLIAIVGPQSNNESRRPRLVVTFSPFRP